MQLGVWLRSSSATCVTTVALWSIAPLAAGRSRSRRGEGRCRAARAGAAPDLGGDIAGALGPLPAVDPLALRSNIDQLLDAVQRGTSAPG
jgi:hypothetical protein